MKGTILIFGARQRAASWTFVVRQLYNNSFNNSASYDRMLAKYEASNRRQWPWHSDFATDTRRAIGSRRREKVTFDIRYHHNDFQIAVFEIWVLRYKAWIKPRFQAARRGFVASCGGGRGSGSAEKTLGEGGAGIGTRLPLWGCSCWLHCSGEQPSEWARLLLMLLFLLAPVKSCQ